MEFAGDDGLVDLVTTHGRLRRSGPAVTFGPDRSRWCPGSLDGGGEGPGEAHRPPLHLSWELVGEDTCLQATVSVRNDGTSPVRIWSLEPLVVEAGRGGDLRLNGPPPVWSVFTNGFQSWSGTRAWRTDEADQDPPLRILRASGTDPVHRSGGEAGLYKSDLVMGLRGHSTGSGLAVGFLGGARQYGRVVLDVREGAFRSLAAVCDLDGVHLAPGEEVRSETVQARFGADAVGLLERHAEDLGQAQRARVPDRPPAGWCSWYYYFTKVTEADVRENLEALAGPDRLMDVDYVMVDDGHQSAIGDWLDTNDDFPSGMAALATDIRAAGFDAGIWWAPFLVQPDSRVAREHPEWLLRDERGRAVTALWNPPWTWRPIRALDTSRPDVLDWIERVARTMRHEWGYRVLKLDFLYAGALPGVRAVEMTRAEATRRGLEAVRVGAGEDTFLLGCGCPLGPAVGVVDGMRIGADVAPWWTNLAMRTVMRDQHGISTRHAVRNTVTRAFMHQRLWANDPDCLMVRDTNTRLTLDEVQLLATVMGLTDGMLVISDRLTEVAPSRREVVDAAVSFTGGVARTVDLFDRGLPEMVVSRHPTEVLVGVCNHGPRPEARELDLRSVPELTEPWPDVVDEVWTGARLVVDDGRVDLGAVPRHGARVLRVPTRGG